MPKLVIFRGDSVEHEIRLAGSTIRLGRHDRNDVVLDDSANGVSRFHAEIRAEAGTYFIVDLNSRNGVWISGRRIKDKAALALGVPVTLGGFELALEDDASATEFGGVPLLNQHTVVNAASVDRKDGPSRPAARSWSTRAPLTATQRQALLWSGAAATVLLICAITFAVLRYGHQPPPTVAENLPLVPPPETSLPPENPNKPLIDQNLADARVKMDTGDYAGALREHLQTVLELDPENTQALEMKRQADEAVAAAALPLKVPRPVAKPEEPAEVETPGIPRKPNEAWPDYTSRVRRIQVAFAEGKSSLDKQEFAAAIAHFRSVERDQPRYQGVDLSITEATVRQQKALEEAMNGGQLNEQAGKLREARLWYRKALEIDANSPNARDKMAALTERLTKSGLDAFETAEVRRKRNENARAIELYKETVDLLPRGHEKAREALKWLESLKP